ncbi:MAG TPA: serine/threonine-protein kinase [Geodermatophilus sp.]|nr:serine/threonine-protein kinase [Geodermatophilus sp.]
MDLPVGTRVGGYEIRRMLGSGGMGAVYLARHPTLPRDVALKILHVGLAATPEMRARFEREAELLCRLSHPNVADVLDRGQEGGLLWMAMQYVPGTDLARILEEQGPLPPDRALAVVAAVGEALDHAHSCGLLHRDVKPANILLAPQPGGGERAVLTDFGISRAMDGSVALTREGEVLASFAYAAPEQIAGAALDPRADVYALGAVLFELLTGRRVFERDDLPALLFAVMHLAPPDVRTLRPDLPPPLSAVLARALAKDPRERFGSCAEFVAAARACWPARLPAPETVVGRVGPPPPPPQGARPARRSRTAAVLAGGAAVLVAAGVALVAVRGGTDPGGDAAGGSGPSTEGSAVAAGSTASGAGSGAWGEVQFIVEDFPRLLPASMEDTGWGGGTCAPTVFDLDVHADVGITCQYPNGITAEVAHYPDLAARDARRAEMAAADAPDSPETWFHDGARAGVRYLSGGDFDYAWQWITFQSQDKLLYVVILEWSGHTHDDLDDAWFTVAPFAGPAGT